MKQKYLSPSIKVEKLGQADVLCASTEASFNTPDNHVDTIESLGDYWDFSAFL